MIGTAKFIAQLEAVTQQYGATLALDNVSLAVPEGCQVGLIGPDGVGKSTLLGLIAGVRRVQQGTLDALGGNMADRRHRAKVCPRIAYMPQGLGRNLYPDLSVRENIEFFGRLFGQGRVEREARIADLTESTGLAPFVDRPAKKLSGGMKQKLGLCCALIHDPDLLILDEPTTGVDPLSRRQFWKLIERTRLRRPGLSVLVATAYMEEAEQFDWIAAMDAGRILSTGSPSELKARTQTDNLEDAFIALLPAERRANYKKLVIPQRQTFQDGPVISAHDLTCKFGDFLAVDRVNFSIEQGEIFGFLGSNGCGKTTTMKMLTGLLPPTSGDALLFGRTVDATDLATRSEVGYMSQSFSLYSELTVRQNLVLHAHLFHLPKELARSRLEMLVEKFELTAYLDQNTADLPLGIRQRLSLAVAIVHGPKLLILDEPTSGVDPLARDSFWELLIDLSRKEGVTIFISTHFMNEAARCDRIALMDAGGVLAMGAPATLVSARKANSLEEAFISYLEEARNDQPDIEPTKEAKPARGSVQAQGSPEPVPVFSLRRLLAYSRREGLELLRDPIRLGFALFATAFLMLVLSMGISTDVINLSFAVLDHDQTPESRAYIQELTGSRYFQQKSPVVDYQDLSNRLQSASVWAVLEVPPHFGRDLNKGSPTTVGAWVDGAMPFRAETISGYLRAVNSQFLNDFAIQHGKTLAAAPATIETRFLYNQDFDSVYAMVPGTMALQLVLIPAILMALSIVREKEMGSITNLYVTPVTRIEFLIGKQLPYIAIAMVNFLMLVLMAIFLFNVPLKGSFLTLSLGALLYVTATTGFGMLISAFTKTQIAALFGTAILTVLPATQFSGMLIPVSSLTGVPKLVGEGFPMTYFLKITIGTFTKALGFADLAQNLIALAIFIPILTLLTLSFMRKQEL